jgi:AcrR family transcriptional regulator
VTSDESVAEVEPPVGDSSVSRRELAVARSLYTAKTRAENRLQRFLDAALELMNDGDSGRDFTVHEVVERSGQSLRLFYQYFNGKHELLLALFEESVRSTTELLRQQVAEESNSLDRLHRFVVEYYRLCRPARVEATGAQTPAAPAMVDFAQQLLTSHPAEAALAFEPLVALFGDVLDDAAGDGYIRPGLRNRPISGMVLEVIMFNAFSVAIGGASAQVDTADLAEELWDVILNGVRSEG